MFYRVNWKAAEKLIVLESGAVSAPAVIAGFTDLGTFKHSPPAVTDDSLPGSNYSESHVLYQHVQEKLYHIGHYDMQRLTINLDPVRSISIGSGTVNLAVGATSDLDVTPTPANASNKVTWTSSDPTKATVDKKGVITGVAAGSVTITATSKEDDTKTATRAVTVS